VRLVGWAGWWLGGALLVGSMVVSGCGGPPPPGRVVTVAKQDLVLDVEVTGTLKSLESMNVGPPAQVTDTWEFKILRMVPEGTRVNNGQEVLAFDPSQLEQKLREYESEMAAMAEELHKTRAESTLAVLNDRLEREEAEAKKRKAELKADKPADLTAGVVLKVSGIERDLARREVAFRLDREKAKRRQERSYISYYESRLERAKARVAEIKASIAAMAVKAKRDGTVVYRQDWRGEKKKPGDGMWKGETVLEIASLERMAALGQVDEVDASKVTVGQRVILRLEAHPDKEYPGTVERVASLVQTESPESRVKVVGLEIKLAATDPMLMRPAMRFRGRIEIARVPTVVQIPLAAIESTAAGPVVTRLAGGAASQVPVRLGRRGREAVEVTGGVVPGDRILIRSATAAGKEPGFRVGAS
jgi:HlyD family secretion protein